MRREKFIEFGGPNGGDGGRGGDVVFKGDASLTSLFDLRLHPHQRAGNGAAGMGDQKSGKSGTDRVISLPLGTVVIDDATDEILLEVMEEQSYRVLKGGKGGLGNVHFKSSTNRAPRYAQPGEPGQEMCIRLELKLIADVGLVGFPNAGKSTLISAISNARPKIADYPFTTLIPNLGVVKIGNFKSIVVADIPGLIENAHQGIGLGDRFLKHIQRTAVLAFLIDCSGFQQIEPLTAYTVLLNELTCFSPNLADKKRVVLLTKTDIITDKSVLEDTVTAFKEKGEVVFPISAVTRQGLDRMTYHLADLVEACRSDSATVDQDHRQKGE